MPQHDESPYSVLAAAWGLDLLVLALCEGPKTNHPLSTILYNAEHHKNCVQMVSSNDMSRQLTSGITECLLETLTFVTRL